MIKLFLYILAVGTFYNLGKNRSKKSGILWAFLSLLVLVVTIKLLSLVSIGGFLAFLIAIIMLFPLGILEMFISNKYEKKRVSISIISLLYDSLNSTFSLKFDVYCMNDQNLKITIFNKNEKFVAEIFNDSVKQGIKSFDFILKKLESGTYIMKLNIEKKEFINKFAYSKGRSVIILKQ